MITKEEYLKWKKNPSEMNYEVFYTYYIEHKKPEWREMDYRDFVSTFDRFLQMTIVRGTQGDIIKVDYKNIIKKCIEYFDRKFNVNL